MRRDFREQDFRKSGGRLSKASATYDDRREIRKKYTWNEIEKGRTLSRKQLSVSSFRAIASFPNASAPNLHSHERDDP